MVIPGQELKPLPVNYQELEYSPGALLRDEYQRMALNKLRIEQKKLVPGLSLGYFIGTNAGTDAKLYPGYQVGLSVPLWFVPQQARIQAAKIEKEISATDAANYTIQLQSKYYQLMAEIRKNDEVIQQYLASGKGMAEEIIKFARLAYGNGDIDFYQYIQNIENATEIELEYLENLNKYNQAVLELNYLNL